MKNNKVLFLSGIVIFIAGLFLFLNSPPRDMKDDSFLIEKGESLKKAAEGLEAKNLIKNKDFFVYLALIEGKSKILTGKYKIYKGMSTHEIIKKISAGEIILRKVTIPEGFNIYEIAEKLEENEITSANTMLKYSFDAEFLPSIGIDRPSAEGLLFPDTYVFAESQDAREIIAIMHNKFKSIISSLNIPKNNKLTIDFYELITMASLIEKEATISEEKGYISSVFYNRLSKKIPLGCDPTVQYALKKFRDRLTQKDLKYDSPFNTYKNRGLPPGPICSPGRESIIAALNPVKSPYLYFVSRNNGSHYFSKTLTEHNKAVEFYQKGIKNGFDDRQKL